jgi:transcriptional regulator with XRE-family HTH domain
MEDQFFISLNTWSYRSSNSIKTDKNIFIFLFCIQYPLNRSGRNAGDIGGVFYDRGSFCVLFTLYSRFFCHTFTMSLITTQILSDFFTQPKLLSVFLSFMENFFSSNLIFLRERKGENQIQAATALDLTRSTYANYEVGENLPKLDVINRILGHFNVSFEELVQTDLKNVGIDEKSGRKKNGQNVGENVGKNVGIGGQKQPDSPILSVVQEAERKEIIRMPQVITVDHSGEENVIMVPVRARAGYLNGYGDPEFVSHLPTYRLPFINHGTYRMFEVGGLSMHPTLEDKDIIITKFVENLHEIRDDRVYVVLTKQDGVVVKRVLNRIQTDNSLILKSDNIKHREEYPPIVVSPEDVLEIWYAVAYMSRYMRSPTEMYTRVIDLEGRLTLLEHELRKSTH